ncbi:MAG: RNA-binding protein [Nanoarchaeota archaeon]
MSKKLYVGNLPFDVDQKKLAELFSAYGEVGEVALITFKDTGRSKGFGFVTLQSDEMAEKAIAEMNGKEIEGRKLTVNEARPLDTNKPRSNNGGGFGRRSFGRERRNFDRY